MSQALPFLFGRRSSRRPRVILAVLGLFAGLACADAACLAPPVGLVSWWSGDDHAQDLIGFNHGVLRSGASYTDGRVGRAFSFDGTSNHVQSTTWGLNVGTADFTIVGWARTTSTRPLNPLVEWEGHNPALYITGSGTLRLVPFDVGPAVGGFNDGQFHHFAVVRSAGIASFYKDGALIGTNFYSASIYGNRFFIGGDMANFFQGAIDEVGFFSRALSASEIQSIYSAGADGLCKPPLRALPFFIEAEDFDFNGGQHRTDADVMPYLGGAYAGLSATAEIDYHDPGANEYADYRPASQSVALVPSGDLYRDSYSVPTTYRIGYCDPGDWFNYTRVFPSPARGYHLFARLSSAAAGNAIQIDEVVSGAGTTNQTLQFIGRATGPPSGGWDSFQPVPVNDASGLPVILTLGGQRTFRITILAGGNEDINYLMFVPGEATTNTACVASPPGQIAWWSADGHPRDIQGTNHGTLRNGATYSAGRTGEAFLFDGVNDYVETALDVQPSAMANTTWECWVFPTIVAGGRFQILSSDDGGFDRSLLIESGVFAVFVGYGVFYPVGITPNQWQHIAVVFSTNNVEFYKNGVRFSFNAAPAGQGTGNKLNIGRNPGFGEYSQGRIDEVGIYNRVLSQAEIQSIFNAGAAGRCKGPGPCSPITIMPVTISPGIAGRSYSQVFSGSGGMPPYTFASVGVLPAALTISSNGVLSGTLASAGTFSFAVRAFGGDGCSAVQNYSLSATLPVPPCANLPAGLVSWWRAEGNADDAIGISGPTNLNGTMFAPGKVGQAFQFDGATNFLRVPPAPLNVGTGDFTMEGWIQTTATKEYSGILSFDSYSPGLYVRGYGALQLYPHGPSVVTPTTRFNDGQFHHFAAVRAASQLTYYRDGVAVGSVFAPSLLNAQNFYIGTSTYGGENFQGLIDELSFYNRALSASEVSAIFSQGSGGKCGPPGTNTAPDIALSVTNLNFGSITVGAVRDLTLSISNVGSGTLTVTSLATNNPAFRVVSPAAPFAINPGAQTALTLRFAPTVSGSQNGNLTIASDDSDEAALTVGLTGTATNLISAVPDIALGATALNFGSVNVGSSADRTLTISNVGTATLTVTSLATNNPAFRVVAPITPFNVSASSQTTVTLRFSPAASGTQNGNLSIASNDPDEATLGVSLTGVGVGVTSPPDVALSATNLNFGSVTIGATNELTLTVSNVGANTLTISSLLASNPVFRFVSSPTPISIAAGTQTVIVVGFSPTTAGAQTGSLSLASNDPDEANLRVTLSGLGVAVPPVITALTPGNGMPGTSVTIVGTNFGSSAGNVSVRFGNSWGFIQSFSPTQIVAVVPFGTSGSVPVTVAAGGQVSLAASFNVEPPPASPDQGRITDVNFGASNDVRIVLEPTVPNPNLLLLQSADTPLGPWWKEPEFRWNTLPLGYEFFTPLRPYLPERYYRFGLLSPPAALSEALPYIRYIAPKEYVRPGQSITLLGGNFDPNPAGNIVRFELVEDVWIATVTEAATNYLVVTTPPTLITGANTGLLYRVTVSTSRGTGNGVGCSVIQSTANTLSIRPDEVYISLPPGSGKQTLVVGGGVPPYRLVPQTTNELAVAQAILNGPLLEVVARTTNFGSISVRVQDSSQFTQTVSTYVGVLKSTFDPYFDAQFHTLLGGSAPGLTMTIIAAPSSQSLQVERIELQLQNTGLDVSRLRRSQSVGLLKFFYSSTIYEYQYLSITEVLPGRARFDILSRTDGAIEVSARGELIESPPTIVINVLDLDPVARTPQPVHEELILADEILRLPAGGGQNFSVRATFTSVSVRDDAYLPLTKTFSRSFITTNVAANAPRIDRIRPIQGEITRNVRIRGVNFGPTPPDNSVTFAGPGGTRVPAEIVLRTNNELVVTVPRGAISGPVRLTVGGNTGNDFQFYVRFHAETVLLFDPLTNNVPTPLRLIHQQPVDEYETLGEIGIQKITATLDQGRLAIAGVISNQVVGTAKVLNFYVGRESTNVIVYRGQETNAARRHLFEVRTSPSSSFVLGFLYAADDPDGSGISFQVQSPEGLFQFNPGVMVDYRFNIPIYRPPQTPGADVNVRIETISRDWMWVPDDFMRVIVNSARRVH